jgi:hypothetical protein
MNWREVMTYLLFVVLATVIWYGRSLRAEHDTTVDVRVHYVGIPGQVMTAESLPSTIRATVRDAGMRLRLYHRKPLQISVDLTGHFTDESGELRVSSDLLRTLVARQLQGTTALQHIQPDQIHTTYYTQQQRSLPILLRHNIRCATGFQLSEPPRLMQTHVMVYGTSHDLDTLTRVQTQVLSLTERNDSAQYTVGLIAPKGVRLQQQTVQVLVATERYTERVMELPIRAEGVPAGKHMLLFPHQVRATMRVGVGRWSEVKDGDVEAVVVYRDSLDQLPVELRTENPYLSHLRATPSSVEFIIEN